MYSERINHYYSRILQEMAFRTQGSFGKPTGVIILLTNRCNARCVHCHSWKLHEGNKELSTAGWESVLHQLREWLGPIFVSITGGETLLRSDAIPLAEQAGRLGFWTEFLTNGFLLDPEKARRLVQSGIQRIKVSLDGSLAEIHDLIRGKRGFFERATGALRMLVEEKGRLGKGPLIWAKTSIMSHNVDDLANIARLVREIGVDGVEYQAIEPTYYSEQLTDPDWYRSNPLWVRDPARSDRAVHELKALKSDGLPIVNTLENLDMIKSYFQDPGGLAYKVHAHEYSKKKPQCRAWVGGLQIMPDGGLKMCHFMAPFASAKDGKLESLWKQRKQCWKEPCPYQASR